MTDELAPITDENATPTRIGGIPPRIAAVLCYLPCSPVNLIMACLCAFGEPKENRFLRVHGFQILFAFVAQILFVLVTGPINGVVGLLTMELPATPDSPPEMSQAFLALAAIESVMFFIFIALLFVGFVQAARGRYFRIPIIGGLAERFA